MTTILPLKVINLWSGPGGGKSTTAAGLFNIMKHMRLDVELVTEVAKDRVYAKDFQTLGNQLLITAEAFIWVCENVTGAELTGASPDDTNNVAGNVV